MRSLKINGICQAMLCRDDYNDNAQSHTTYLMTRRGDNKLCIILMLHHFENNEQKVHHSVFFDEVGNWFNVLTVHHKTKETFLSL
jgi:hypothetical protein